MEPFIGEITLFGGNFAPRGWALCDGQLLNISGNPALFSLLGTTYGGDGRTTFALPDCRGRFPLHRGSGPGLTERPLGARGGSETVSLTVQQIPSHRHELRGSDLPADGTGVTPSQVGGGYSDPVTTTKNTQSTAMKPTLAGGGGQPHENRPPFQVVNYIIALVGVFPSRS